MELNYDTPQSALPSSAVELIVENGRLAGTRRPLPVPLTVIGRAVGGDIRLDVPGVEQLHCVIVQGLEGVVLRDLGTPTGTLVNGEPVTSLTLKDGDLVTVGPFHFRMALGAASASQFLLAELEAVEKKK